MKTTIVKPKYTIQPAKDAPKGTEPKVYELWVEFPDTLAELGEEERVMSIARRYILDHCVQSAFKGALAKEAGKRSEKQKKLLEKVFAGEVLDAREFIPEKRTVARKDNQTTSALKAKWDGMTDEKKVQLGVNWGMVEPMPDGGDVDVAEAHVVWLAGLTLDDMIEGYWEWNDKDVARRLAAEQAALDM